MESFGDRLRKEREQRGITLEEVSMSTKIGIRMLQALEEQRFEQLPGGIFNKGFVRAYARHLGLDEQEAVADYLEASGTAPTAVATEPLPILAQQVDIRAQAESISQAAEGSRAEQIPWEKFALALLVLAFGFAVWGSFGRPSQESPTSLLPPTQMGSSKSTPATTADQGPLGDDPIQTSAGTASPRPTSPAAAGAFLVLVQARQDSWVQITADGQEVMHDTLTAASQKTIEARKEIIVKTRNIGGLDFSFNGKPLPPQGDHNEVKVLNFDPNGLQNPGSEKPTEKTQAGRPQV
jgi:cytoskeleton protein RodZ